MTQEVPEILKSGVLDFHLPHSTEAKIALHLDSPELLYRQLVCWCLIQRYRYYVLTTPRATDQEYDSIENYVRWLEFSNGFDINPYSPIQTVGSSDYSSYPNSIHRWFYHFTTSRTP